MPSTDDTSPEPLALPAGGSSSLRANMGLDRVQWFDDHPSAQPAHESTTLLAHCQPVEGEHVYCGCHCFDCWEAVAHNSPRCVCNACEHRGKAQRVYASHRAGIEPLMADDPDRWAKFNAAFEDEPDYTPVPVAETEAYVDEAGNVHPYSRVHKAERELGWRIYREKHPRRIDVSFTGQREWGRWPKRIGDRLEGQGSQAARK